jgi:hypothetical protein
MVFGFGVWVGINPVLPSDFQTRRACSHLQEYSTSSALRSCRENKWANGDSQQFEGGSDAYVSFSFQPSNNGCGIMTRGIHPSQPSPAKKKSNKKCWIHLDDARHRLDYIRRNISNLPVSTTAPGAAV